MAVNKSIAIIGEGETEWFYFDSLRIACRYPFKVEPDFPQHSDIPHMAKLAEDYIRREYDYGGFYKSIFTTQRHGDTEFYITHSL